MEQIDVLLYPFVKTSACNSTDYALIKKRNDHKIAFTSTTSVIGTVAIKLFMQVERLMKFRDKQTNCSRINMKRHIHHSIIVQQVVKYPQFKSKLKFIIISSFSSVQIL